MVTETNSIVHAAGGYGPPGGGYPPGGGGMPPGGGGYGGPPQGGPPGGGYGGPPQGGPPGGGYGGPPQGGPPGGGYGGPPPGGGFGPPGGMPGGMMPGAGGDVNTTLPLILGIVSIFCCWPAAILIIIFAVQAKKAKETGDMATATSKAKTATLIGWIVIGLGVLGWIGAIVSQIMARA